MTGTPATPTGNIHWMRDVVFTTDARRPLRLHLLRPSRPSGGPLPVVVWIFGGAFRMGSKDDEVHRLFPLVERGYAGAAIEYRFSSEALFPAQLHDCKAAIRFLRGHAGSFGLDPGRIGAWGASSGGHLATMLGTTAGLADLEGDQGWPGVSSGVQAVCDWFGPTDFLRMDAAGSAMCHDAPDSPESELVGGPIQNHPDRVARANPITYISAGRSLPPFLVMHGDQDPLVPFNQSELLVDALRAAGADVTFQRLAGGGHGGPLFETHAVRHAVDAFFDRHLRPRT